jgi:hypothetical protein
MFVWEFSAVNAFLALVCSDMSHDQVVVGGVCFLWAKEVRSLLHGCNSGSVHLVMSSCPGLCGAFVHSYVFVCTVLK